MMNSGRKNCFLYGVMAGWHHASNPELLPKGVKAMATAVNGGEAESCCEYSQLPLKPAIGKTKASTIAAKQITPSVLIYPLAEINVSTIAQTNNAHQPLKGKG